MKTYSVLITQEVMRDGIVQVEAENEEDARRQVEDMIDDVDEVYSNVEWGASEFVDEPFTEEVEEME